MMKQFAAPIAIALVAALAVPAGAQNAPSATAYYEAALSAMKSLPQPAYVTFTATVNAEGMGFAVIPEHHVADLAIGWGDALKPQTSWQSDHRTQTDTTTILTEKGERLLGESPLWDPTWNGAYDWLRYGVFGSQQPQFNANVKADATPAPSATPVQGGAIKTIAVVSAMGAQYYRITDGGSASCPSGAPGHALHLSAVRDPSAHPLSDVVVEAGSLRFCMMRFSIADSGVVGLTGFSELHFNDAGGYWMTTDATTTLLIRAFGIGVKKAVLRFSYRSFAFPASLPDSLFDFPEVTR